MAPDDHDRLRLLRRLEEVLGSRGGRDPHDQPASGAMDRAGDPSRPRRHPARFDIVDVDRRSSMPSIIASMPSTSASTPSTSASTPSMRDSSRRRALRRRRFRASTPSTSASTLSTTTSRPSAPASTPSTTTSRPFGARFDAVDHASGRRRPLRRRRPRLPGCWRPLRRPRPPSRRAPERAGRDSRRCLPTPAVGAAGPHDPLATLVLATAELVR